ncbi:MAG: hypothetical protein Q4D21_08370 [Phascolarctobacterium sp.]|nr:hypothetical protein [Phascolarctobacterium sp.]
MDEDKEFEEFARPFMPPGLVVYIPNYIAIIHLGEWPSTNYAVVIYEIDKCKFYKTLPLNLAYHMVRDHPDSTKCVISDKERAYINSKIKQYGYQI